MLHGGNVDGARLLALLLSAEKDQKHNNHEKSQHRSDHNTGNSTTRKLSLFVVVIDVYISSYGRIGSSATVSRTSIKGTPA
ncbi:hypothetical protein ACFX11_014469 [Malus domestica]